MRSGSVILFLCASLSLAHAAGDGGGDRAAALAAARARFAAGDWEGARAQFVAAQQLAPHPALDWDLSLCEERLGRLREALASLDRFLSAAPDPGEAQAARDRESALRARLAIVTPPERRDAVPTTPPPSSSFGRRYGWALGLGAVSAGALAAALGLHLSIAQTCEPRCDPALRGRADAVYALDAVGAAVAVADLALWIATAVKRAPPAPKERSARAGGQSF
jgi:hypothetical protein